VSPPDEAIVHMPSDALELPPWAVVSAKRREHIGRVVAVLDEWALAMRIGDAERRSWHDAGRWHDALRDANEETLRAMTGDRERPPGFLHGPAAALRLEAGEESRRDVLDAIRWHTVGSAEWARTGRALYMADFLEPGRSFMRADRAFLAARVPDAFDEVFRQVVRMRLEWTLREGKALAPESVALWNHVCDAFPLGAGRNDR
jgi:2-amino-4-hydroxy-6-hydroxymethyldihydropteridine diphosphokinase